jgi:hypothetical protein
LFVPAPKQKCQVICSRNGAQHTAMP